MLDFPVMLLPLRPGHLLLPTVEITPASSEAAGAGGEEALLSQRTPGRGSSPIAAAGQDRKAPQGLAESRQEHGKGMGKPPPVVSCETDYRNQGQAVVVIPSIRSTTIDLDQGNSGGGARLVESERRSSTLAG